MEFSNWLAVDASKPNPMIVVDPRTSTPYIIVRKDIFERLSDVSYDDSPWTDEEIDLLAAEVDAMLDDDMAVEDSAQHPTILELMAK